MAKTENKANDAGATALRPPVIASTVVKTDRGVVVNSAPVAKQEPSPTGNKLTFSMFCTVRAVPMQRQAGMRAFTKTNEATLSEWDAIFKRY